MLRTRRGFTLIELLVVVVIVGFLQIRQLRRSMRRQREAAVMVRQGRDPADAANAVGMPFAQKIVFVGMARLFGNTCAAWARSTRLTTI